VTPIKASMHDTLEALTMFGVGTSRLLNGEVEAEENDDALDPN